MFKGHPSSQYCSVCITVGLHMAVTWKRRHSVTEGCNVAIFSLAFELNFDIAIDICAKTISEIDEMISYCYLFLFNMILNSVDVLNYLLKV
jgi:hypothetical protein